MPPTHELVDYDPGRRLLAIYTGRAGEGIVMAPDRSGWGSFSFGDPWSRSFVFVHVALAVWSSTDSPFIVNAVHLEVVEGVTPAALRSIPLGRIEAALNRPSVRGELLSAVNWTDDYDGSPGALPEDVPGPDGDWPWWMWTPARPTKQRIKLKIPTSYRKPDSFYEQVAEAFAYLASMSTRPANDLAEANDVPVTTVHGWVKEARRRGLLAGGERSRRAKGES